MNRAELLEFINSQDRHVRGSSEWLYERGLKTSLGSFERIYDVLGTRFDYYVFESDVADLGKKMVLDNIQLG